MNRIDERFAELARCGEKALVTYLTAGDPNLEISEALLETVCAAGADILEIGVPFSDPLADGPSIQAASQRALEAGTQLPQVFGLVERLRRKIETPIVLMTYFNPVLKYGMTPFAEDARAAGADGVIMTDLPPEEAGDWKRAADAVGISTIFLLAPTSTEERIRRVAEMATGFIYCVSRTGVTGARDEAPEGLKELIDAIRRETDLPVVVGFGISRPEHVAVVTSLADGAVVGSALVDLVSQFLAPQRGNERSAHTEKSIWSLSREGTEELLQAVDKFVKELKCIPRNSSRS